jgi:hypothetical protein
MIFDEKVNRCLRREKCKRKRCGARERELTQGKRQRWVMSLQEYGVFVSYSPTFVWKGVCQLSLYGIMVYVLLQYEGL